MGGLRLPHLVTLIGMVVYLAGLGTCVQVSARFDHAFTRFLHDHGYPGGAVTALKDGRVILSRGYGVNRRGSEVKAGSSFPVTALSQSLTAVAILKLVQDGRLEMDDRVFGKKGVLHMIHPIRPQTADPRLYDITVGHLLKHSAGWDSTKAPLYDPVLNEVYQSRGHDAVPDMAQAMDAPSPLDVYSVIRYAISQPLHFTPGTRVVASNLGYLLLGRVIEETTSLMYEDYIKKTILNPCGMWRTRLVMPDAAVMKTTSGAKKSKRKRSQAKKKEDENVGAVAESSAGKKHDGDISNEGELALMDILDPLSVDAALGWSSTTLDLARLARCVFDSDELLSDRTLETLLRRQGTATVQHDDTWLAAGFKTNTRGEVWQDGDPHGDDVILYHDLLSTRRKDNVPSSVAAAMPDTWVILLHGSHLHRLRHRSKDLMRQLAADAARWIQYDNDDNTVRLGQGLTQDLSDIDASSVLDDVLVKFRVDEHHLDAYVSAARHEGYDVRWVSPYTHRRHTSFIVTSRLARATGSADFRLEHGLGEKRLLSRKLHMERNDYNLTFLQSYRSQSHAEPYSFLAIFRRHAYSTDTQLKYGTGHLPEPYDKLVHMYREKQFHPLAQSVLPHNSDKEERISFIFVQTPQHSGSRHPVDFKNYYRLSDAKLDRAILLNANQGRSLSFLDVYRLQGKPRFAAVFSNATWPRWTWQGGLTQHDARRLMESRFQDRLYPAIVVAYTDRDDELKFSVFLKTDEDVQRPQSVRGDRDLHDSGGLHDETDLDSELRLSGDSARQHAAGELLTSESNLLSKDRM